jgi:hypothetical protein
MADVNDRVSDTMTEDATANILHHDDVLGQAAPLNTVVIPDLFESFGSRIPTINPHYCQVSEEAVEWTSLWDPVVISVVAKTADQVAFADILKMSGGACAKQTSLGSALSDILTQSQTNSGLSVTG